MACSFRPALVGEYAATVSYHNRQLQKSLLVEAGATNDAPFQFSLGAVELETTPAGASVRTANGGYLGQTPLVIQDMTPQTVKFDIALLGYEPVAVMLDIVADQTNVCRTNLVSIGYVSAMRQARGFLTASNYQAAVQAAGAALDAKPEDADVLALRKEANGRLTAQREVWDRLTRPQRVFSDLCSRYQDAGLFTEHELKTSRPAAEVAQAIIHALTNEPAAFRLVGTASPEPETYQVVAQQSTSLGILGGSERDCMVVIGQAKDDETQIWFKVLEYEVKHTEVMNGLLNFQDRKQLIAVAPSRMPMTEALQTRVQGGVRTVMGKIQQAISQ